MINTAKCMKITIISVGKIKEKFYREAVAEYAKRLSSYCKFQIIELTDENVKYIKNRYNYGLAGNICKALTLPTEKYFWIVFDDTGLDFSNWEYIEKGLKEDYDCVLTTNYYDVKKCDNYDDKAALYLMLIYCFAGIYKTDLITDDVILYALTDIYTVHSQMALISALFNDEKRRIYLPEKTVAFSKMNPETERGEEYSFNRSDKTFYHFRISHKDFIPGFMQGLQSIKDKKLRDKCVELLYNKRNGFGPFTTRDARIGKLLTEKNRDYLINLMDENFLFNNCDIEIKDESLNKKKKIFSYEKIDGVKKIVLFDKYTIRIWKNKK